jgi:hypothetical protein
MAICMYIGGMKNTPKTPVKPIKRTKHKTTMTIPPVLWRFAQIFASESFGNLSSYVAHLIATDLKDHGINPINPSPEMLAKLAKLEGESKLPVGQVVRLDPEIEKRKVK